MGHKESAGPWVKSASVSAMPSRTGVPASTAVKARALSPPVVAPRTGGLPEVVQHGETTMLADGQPSSAGASQGDAELHARAI